MTIVTQACTVAADDLILRPWSEADAPQIAAIALDAAVAQWNPVARPSAHEWCIARADWSDGRHASWAITSPDDVSTVLGAVSLHHIDQEQRDAEIGYWTTPGQRGRGIATRAVRAAAEFGFDHLQLHRVHLFHAVENAGSCRVAGSASFPYEGTHRQSYRFGDGQWHDEHSHARLDTDQR